MLSPDTDSNIENRSADQLHLRLPRRLRELLKRQAAEEGESVSTIARRALKRELEADESR